ncbi:MAG: adenine phosphoribosyltransferase [Candidatus Omnitrophica bacterium]|nr:adenine phosphoribosyltransferase [Candidatus Omnitrophota bacterium]
MTKTKAVPKTSQAEYLRSLIRDIPDFPKPGIIFKDITPLLKNGEALRMVCDELAKHFQKQVIDQVVGIESRGFIFSPMIAYKLGAGFVPVRKKGKLPHEVERVSYTLEYGEDFLEIHRDAISKGDHVLIVDDVLATGGTAEAVVKLVEKLGGKVIGLAFVIELLFLNGRNRFSNIPLSSLIQYD